MKYFHEIKISFKYWYNNPIFQISKKTDNKQKSYDEVMLHWFDSDLSVASPPKSGPQVKVPGCSELCIDISIQTIGI